MCKRQKPGCVDIPIANECFLLTPMNYNKRRIYTFHGKKCHLFAVEPLIIHGVYRQNKSDIFCREEVERANSRLEQKLLKSTVQLLSPTSLLFLAFL
jgi:hypothetical protein